MNFWKMGWPAATFLSGAVAGAVFLFTSNGELVDIIGRLVAAVVVLVVAVAVLIVLVIRNMVLNARRERVIEARVVSSTRRPLGELPR
jgi:hypothetical protein